MPHPVHVPLLPRRAGPAERLAAIADALEAAQAPVRAFPLAVRPMAVGCAAEAARAHVVVILPDGGREALSPDDARLLARVLADGAAWPAAAAAAFFLFAQATAAELAMGRLLLGRSLAVRMATMAAGPEDAA